MLVCCLTVKHLCWNAEQTVMLEGIVLFTTWSETPMNANWICKHVNWPITYSMSHQANNVDVFIKISVPTFSMVWDILSTLWVKCRVYLRDESLRSYCQITLSARHWQMEVSVTFSNKYVTVLSFLKVFRTPFPGCGIHNTQRITKSSPYSNTS